MQNGLHWNPNKMNSTFRQSDFEDHTQLIALGRNLVNNRETSCLNRQRSPAGSLDYNREILTNSDFQGATDSSFTKANLRNSNLSTLICGV